MHGLLYPCKRLTVDSLDPSVGDRAVGLLSETGVALPKLQVTAVTRVGSGIEAEVGSGKLEHTSLVGDEELASFVGTVGDAASKGDWRTIVSAHSGCETLGGVLEPFDLLRSAAGS